MIDIDILNTLHAPHTTLSIILYTIIVSTKNISIYLFQAVSGNRHLLAGPSSFEGNNGGT